MFVGASHFLPVVLSWIVLATTTLSGRGVALEGHSDWTTFQYNVLRTGWNDHDNINLVIGKHWTVQVSDHPADQLTEVGDRVYAADRTDPGGLLEIQCVDAHDGQIIWTQGWPEWYEVDNLSQATYADGVVYSQWQWAWRSKVWAYDPVTGDTLWKAPYNSRIAENLAPAISNGKLVFAGGTCGGMNCYDI
ncbi:MAG: PQQ-binding-like beta-propeller repeat protein [candidate division Zixibacteria bacterium]|jgi:hypothetical protein|nr:PQQ-binding-like beta-propeller repeat protein [candidate division Zixibacteria bacterium]